eukprot:1357781-Amorphochlora_amoeboformis.AAC.1
MSAIMPVYPVHLRDRERERDHAGGHALHLRGRERERDPDDASGHPVHLRGRERDHARDHAGHGRGYIVQCDGGRACIY